MVVYNTLSGKKEEFIPGDPPNVTIYNCGSTVYDYFHIGNARAFIFADTLHRYLVYRGYSVKLVRNFTDIDDKMIRRANEQGVTVAELAERFIGEYYIDARGLNIMEDDIHPRATQHIDGMIDMICRLIEKGCAYESGGDVYYRARRFKGYGKLSRQPLDELEAGARVDVGEMKEDPMDFALWKTKKEGEPSWPSPWGEGRPGWHIECSVMAKKHLGETIDIHTGGVDLIFPHHENEIAQSEAANSCEFVKYWMHNAFLNIDNNKMGKSLGNFKTCRGAAEKYGYRTIRFFMVSAHYRSPMNYSDDILDQAKNGLARIDNCRENLKFLSANAPEGAADPALTLALGRREAQFIEAMDDDLNTADGLAAIFEMIRDINTAAAANRLSRASAKEAAQALDSLLSVLGLEQAEQAEDGDDAGITALIEQRQQARAVRDFKTADEIRDKLGQMGVTLEDTKDGIKYSKK